MQPQEGMPRKSGGGIFWTYGFIALILIGFTLYNRKGGPVDSDWNTVKSMIVRGEVEKIVVVNKERAQVHLITSAANKYRKQERYKKLPEEGAHLIFVVGSLDFFQQDYKELMADAPKEVPLSFEIIRSFWGDLFFWLVPFGLLIVFWILLSRGMARGMGAAGIFSVGKAKAQMFDKDNAGKITFKDVAGLEEAKVEIMEIVDFLKQPHKYKELGGKIPKGALLVGPPGTGKTLLAKAVAGEANVPFFSISGSDFVEMFVGVGASRVRDLFRQAKEKAPCIVFIDEIDAIGRARSKNGGFSSNDERENTLNQLLTEMDGFGTNSGVIMLAATNRADILDKALMRAGRFDRQIEVGLPDLKERREIFNVHLKNLKLDKNIDREFLAKQTPGFSGADIANVCNEAALIAARRNKLAVDKDDFLDAIDRIVGGLERKSLVITPEEKRITAYHEAGHATVSWILEEAHPLLKVTIIPRGRSLGAAWYLPDERHNTTRDQFMHEMASMLGGRLAEQIFFKTLSTGSLNDLERATKMAYAMVAYYGMSDKVGSISYYDSSGQSDMAFTKPFSERTAQEIDAEVRVIIDKARALAQKVIEKHKTGLTTLAEMLLEKEVIFSDDLENIFGKRKKDRERELREAREARARKIAKITAPPPIPMGKAESQQEDPSQAETTPQEMPARKRGRPPKADKPPKQSPRKRGRPRKADKPATPARKRGRPSKSAANSAAEPVIQPVEISQPNSDQ